MTRQFTASGLTFSRHILAWGLLYFAAQAGAADVLVQGSNLHRDARDAAQKHLPIMLFFTQSACPYCERARREYLGPMARDPATAQRVVLREIAIESSLIDLDGRRVAAREYALVYNVRLFPSVILIDGSGRLLADPLVGYTVPDFYGAYLEARVAAATGKLERR